MGEHPNLVRAHYFMPLNDELYLFLEYVDGGDLNDWIEEGRLGSLRTVLKLALQFCDGMVHATRKGLQAHRDIKAANCMISSDGSLKITDFGLAKAFRQTEAVQEALRSPTAKTDLLDKGPGPSISPARGAFSAP